MMRMKRRVFGPSRGLLIGLCGAIALVMAAAALTSQQPRAQASPAVSRQYDPLSCLNTQHTHADVERCMKAVDAARLARDRTLPDRLPQVTIPSDKPMQLATEIHDVQPKAYLGIPGDYKFVNIWIGPYDGGYTEVVTGCSASDPGQGVVAVQNLDSKWHNVTSSTVYPAPRGASCLSVSSADPSAATVTLSNGTQSPLQFSLSKTAYLN